PGPKVELPADKRETLAEPIRYRAVYRKDGPFRFISHNDLLNQLERAIRRAGWPMAFSQGFHPKMLLTFGPALPLGMAARAEVMEFKARQNIAEDEFLETINPLLPEGLQFRSLRQCGRDCPPLFQDIKQLVYTLDLSDPDVARMEGLSEKLAGDSLNQLSEQYQGKVKLRLAPSENKLWFFLDFEPQKPIRVQEVVERLLGLQNSVYALTREFLVFQDGQSSLGPGAL
ncbi:MAG: TIGR03936 family radical SAM-associated protein, partial [Candidatus Saccharicenans sp.]|nr:TIGR03936 family radical SAM-associated protein [Candidatus Saccharicenans sp.]